MYLKVFKLHADLLKAISHPKRLEIIHLLRGNNLSVQEIQEMLGLPQANLSQHLMILRDAGVVKTKREGKLIYYSLTHKNFIKASDLIREILIERNSKAVNADEYTAKMTDLVPLKEDVVCKMKVSPKTAAYAKKYKGECYYFCAKGCFDEFKKSPKRFLH